MYKEHRFIWVMILVAGGPKQHGSGVPARASWLHHSVAERQKGLAACGRGMRVSKEARDWGGSRLILFVNSLLSQELIPSTRPDPRLETALIHSGE